MRRVAAFLTFLVCVLGLSAGVASGATPVWRVQSTPTPTGHYFPVLSGVACPAHTSVCTAVGSYHSQSGPGFTFQAFAERWNGSKWALQSIPNPIGVTGSSLNGVVCTSGTACTAVGFTGGPFTATSSLVERWNGTKWVVQTAPNPTGSTSTKLDGVACPSATTCTAVGAYITSSHTPRTLVERWNGTKWTVQRPPNPTGTTDSELTAVACTSGTACTAVGFNIPTSGAPRTLAERWNGTKWTMQSTPNPTGSTDSQLSAVACASGAACTAVGNYDPAPGKARTLAERWNGTKWALQSTPNPSSAHNYLSGVACTSSSLCTAVGTDTTSTGYSFTFAERWNGSTWTKQATPNPSGSTGSDQLNAVACPLATDCTAVGSQQKSPLSTSPVLTLAERYS
jgi:hypothetical protein